MPSPAPTTPPPLWGTSPSGRNVLVLPEGEVAAKPTEGSLARGLEIDLRADSKSIGAETALINWLR